MLEWKIGGCRFRLHILFPASLCLLLFTGFRETLLWSLLAALLHEGGHLLVMVLCGIPPRQVQFCPFGVVITEGAGVRRGYGKDALVALGGPAANGLAALSGFCLSGTDSLFFLANTVLGLFNLLPAESLDGGRAVNALLCLRLLPEKAEKLTFFLSLCVILPVTALGILILLRERGNFTLLAAGVYLLLCPLMKRRRLLLRGG